MAAAWYVAKGEYTKLFPEFNNILDMPWTHSFIIRKRQQVDSLNEIPKEKRPPEMAIWWGTPEEIEEWIDKVYNRKKEETELTLSLSDIE
jgi:hypothetical protein